MSGATGHAVGCDTGARPGVGFAGGFAFILVIFILLVIVGATIAGRGYGGYY